MSGKPLRLQLAIQGGGAKICALLAAAECVQELVNQKQLEITRLAGTSAGSIVACLLAAGVPIGEVRQRLRSMGKGGFQKLFPPLAPWKMWALFLSGNPFWDTKPLQKLLAEFFNQRGFSTLGDIREKTGKRVLITASDITNARRLDYQEDHVPIVNTLIQSCSLPYVFITYKNCGDNAIVDGGICENLPIDTLKEEEDQLGKVIGISFLDPMPRTAPCSLKEFSLALMDTSINNSISRARESIGAKRVHRIETTQLPHDGSTNRGRTAAARRRSLARRRRHLEEDGPDLPHPTRADPAGL
jgi:predicted acylesterase/phospholipase RssA